MLEPGAGWWCTLEAPHLGTHRTHQLHYGKCGLKKLVNKKWKTSEMDHFKTCIDLIHSLWNVLFANKYWFIESWFISVKPFCGKHLQFDCSLSPTVPMVLKALGLLGQSIQRSPKIPQPCIYRYKYKCVHIYIYNIIYIYIIIINTIIYIILYRCPKCICTVIMHNYNEISEELQSNRFWYMSAYHAFFAYEVDSQCIHCHISPTQQDKSCFRENIKQ